jgi:hypothetical protein
MELTFTNRGNNIFTIWSPPPKDFVNLIRQIDLRDCHEEQNKLIKLLCIL